MAVFCGIDWAEGRQDIALVDGDGALVAKRRINESVDGIAELTAMLATAGDSADDPIPVAIETPRGLLVAVLRATGRPIYPINPLAVARYRERTALSGKKSDHVDAMALANILRTDAHLHRMLPDDSTLARSITVLARAYQDGVWRRTKLVQELRARLREYYPGFLAALAAGTGSGRGMSATQLASSDARAVLAIAPSPADGLRVSKTRVETALRRGGRQRRIASLAARVVTALRVPQLRQDPMVEQAMRTETLTLLGVLDAICSSVDQLAVALVEAFTQHPDYEIITSFPGLADISGAILLAEVGDDRNRFTDDRALQAFAGSAPITRAWTVSQKTVADSMRRQGLIARRIKRRNGLTRQDKTAPKFADLLRRDFTADAPNGKWVGDMTEIPTAAGKLYLATVIDLYSRRLLGAATGLHPGCRAGR